MQPCSELFGLISSPEFIALGGFKREGVGSAAADEMSRIPAALCIPLLFFSLCTQLFLRVWFSLPQGRQLA